MVINVMDWMNLSMTYVMDKTVWFYHVVLP
jgi:hypothetical protein